MSRTPQPPKMNYPGAAALRPNDPHSPQNPLWGLPAGPAQSAGFMPLPPSMEDSPYIGMRPYPGGLERYPGPFSDRYPSPPDPIRMTVADVKPSAPGMPRRLGISDTPFNLHSGPDQDYPAARRGSGLPPIIQGGIDRVRDGIDRARGDAIGAAADFVGGVADRVSSTPDGANAVNGLQQVGQRLAAPFSPRSTPQNAVPSSGRASPNAYRVNWAFIRQREQANEDRALNANVPPEASGVTIGHGVDLSAFNEAALRTMGLDEPLIARLRPYLGLDHQQSQAALARRPLTLSRPEVDRLDAAVEADRMRGLVAAFDRDSTIGRFADLPAGAQTAIADVYFQYGPRTPTRVPRFWSQVTSGDWEGAHANLLDFGDQHWTRRHLDAGELAPEIARRTLPRRQIQPPQARPR